jgi:hypothetical protein
MEQRGKKIGMRKEKRELSVKWLDASVEEEIKA